MYNKQIKAQIKKYTVITKLKIALENFANLFLLHSLILLCLEFCIFLLSKLIYFSHYREYALKILILMSFIFILHFLIKIPKNKHIINILDKLKFKQRLATAIEFKDFDSEAIILQRKDTLQILNQEKPSEIYKISIASKFLIPILIMLSLNFSLTYISTHTSIQNKNSAEEISEIKTIAKELDKELQKEIKNIDLNKPKLKSIVSELKKNLNKVEKKEDALKFLSIAKNELNDLKKEKSKVKNNQIENKQNQETIQNISDKIDSASKKMNPSSISEYASKNIKESQNKNANKEAKNTDNSKNANSSGTNNENQSNSSQENKGGEESENSQNKNSNESENQNSQTANLGSKNDKQAKANTQSNINANNGSSQNGKKGIGNGKLHELLSNSVRLGGKSTPEYVSGKDSKKGLLTYQEVKNMPNEAGDFIDYQKLYQEYSDEANYNSNNTEIPNGMKNLVKDYFSKINE